MTNGFEYQEFSRIDIEDPFFDTLKRDYPGFVDWFKAKAQEGRRALVFVDAVGIGAFIALKPEEEVVELTSRTLPLRKRLKISTFRVAERYQGQRIGEGGLGLVLWKWQRQEEQEIYVTVFAKQENLISMLRRFGFEHAGEQKNGEEVYVRSRQHVDLSDPYKSFPFISKRFGYAGYIIIDDKYHDTMFAYSELANNKTLRDKLGSSVRNGLGKIYVGKARSIDYYVGEPVLVYRKYTGQEAKSYRSCITSYCVVTNAFQAKRDQRVLLTFEELKAKIRNKSVFAEEEIRTQYESFNNVTIIELLYCGFFGAGNNVNLKWLRDNGMWTTGSYPTKMRLSPEQFQTILRQGKINVQDIIID